MWDWKFINKIKQCQIDGSFDKADWDKFNRLCIDGMVNYSLDDDIDFCSDRLITIIINVAEESIPKSEGKLFHGGMMNALKLLKIEIRLLESLRKP